MRLALAGSLLAAACACALAAAAACALAACGSSEEPRRAAGSGSAARPAGGAAPAPPAPDAAPEAAPSAGEYPAACAEYREVVAKLARCGDALLASTAENFRATIDRQWAAWAKLPDRERAELAAICRRSSMIVKQAAVAAGCAW